MALKIVINVWFVVSILFGGTNLEVVFADLTLSMFTIEKERVGGTIYCTLVKCSSHILTNYFENCSILFIDIFNVNCTICEVLV